jgi:hypothetical protein
MINLDPALLDQDKIRLRRRKRLLLLSIIPLLVLLFLSLVFGRTGIYNLFLSIDHGNKLYSNVSGINNLQKIGNIIEPYIAYYNGGTFKLYEASTVDDLKEAESELKESLKNNPPEDVLCHIYVNISYSIELQGDSAASEKLYDDALVLYNRAEGVLFENNCASKNSSDEASKDEKAETAKDRVSNKRRQTIAAANNETIDNGGDDEGGKQQIDEDTLNKIKEDQTVKTENQGLIIRGGLGPSFNRKNTRSYSKPNF